MGPPPLSVKSKTGGRPPHLAPRSILQGHNTPVPPAPSISETWSELCPLFSLGGTAAPACAQETAQTFGDLARSSRKGWLSLTRERGTSNQRFQRVREMDAESGMRWGTPARG